MKLSVVILNYNVRDLLLGCIASLQVAMEGIEGEIVVVDNASTDGALEAVAERFPDVVRVPMEANVGFARGNNAGFELAKGEYILILNPDTIVQENTIRVMLDLMESRPEVGFSGCKILLPDGTFDPACKRGFPSPWSSFCKVFGLSKLFPKSKIFGGYNLTYLNPDEPASIDALQGCFMFCRTALIKELKGFDPDYFMYGEDLDLCYRARKLGWEIYYTADTSIVHIRGESTRRGSLDALAVFYEAMEIFARKHFRYNLPLLLLVRVGIRLRRSIARALERFPLWWFAGIDMTAILIGFAIGSVIRFGNVFYYPDYAIPWVYLMPPLVFVSFIAALGGYSSDERLPNKAMFGYLLGFFALSTLPYFFKNYAFSRGVVVATTGMGVTVGVLGRFLWLLYRRTFGKESIRRIAFFSRSQVTSEQRNAVRKMFLGKPVTIVGTITPTYSDADTLKSSALGSAEGIVNLIAQHNLTDIFVVDSSVSYGETLQVMNLAGGRPVRFRIAPEMSSSERDMASVRTMHPMPGTAQRKIRYRKRFSYRFGTALAVILGFPVLYPLSRTFRRLLPLLWGVVIGKRLLVSGGIGDPSVQLPAVFTAAALCRDEEMTHQELIAIEQYYLANQSFLLDCEIIVASLRSTPDSGIQSSGVSISKSGM